VAGPGVRLNESASSIPIGCGTAERDWQYDRERESRNLEKTEGINAAKSGVSTKTRNGNGKLQRQVTKGSEVAEQAAGTRKAEGRSMVAAEAAT
jgi:hypothetical protein